MAGTDETKDEQQVCYCYHSLLFHKYFHAILQENIDCQA